MISAQFLVLALSNHFLKEQYENEKQSYQTLNEHELLFQPVDSIEGLKDKLQVAENGYRFSRAGCCEVCDTHVTQLKQEAVSMVQSIQQAQSESRATTNIPNLIGSVNLPPQSPRKFISANGSHIR